MEHEGIEFYPGPAVWWHHTRITATTEAPLPWVNATT
jgi:hypothetical protein